MVIHEHEQPTLTESTHDETSPTQAESDKVSTLEKVRLVTQWLHEKKGDSILAMDISGLSAIAESIVVVTGKSQRHVQTLADEVYYRAKKAKFDIFGVEGKQSGNWILVDLNDVLVQVFQEDARTFYNLEGLWSEAPRIELHLPEDEPSSAFDPTAVDPS